jgi:uncharacterized protein (TIGR02611 family)
MSALRKPIITISGGFLVFIGLIMLVTPGPGLVTIAAGVALWAKEYVWAKRLLRKIRLKLHELNQKRKNL